MNREAAEYFSIALLGWYRANKRDLPWRLSRDPYRVWVSEIMLQQTRVDTVIPYYERFMAKFPTAAALAEAPEEEVLKCWEGLGYYSRARNLQAGARDVLRLHGGIVPDDKEAVSALRGVGPYTSGAIMSIAFNRPEPAVDGNVMRVLSRYFCLEEDIAKPATRVGIEKLAVSLIPEGAAGDFNQALMELGALVCTPKSPGCLTCPVMLHCEGRMSGKEHVLPIKTKAKPPRRETRIAALVVGVGEHAGKLLVRQRPESGLLAQMWELPHVLAPEAAAAPKRRGRGGKAAALAAAAAEAAAGMALLELGAVDGGDARLAGTGAAGAASVPAGSEFGAAAFADADGAFAPGAPGTVLLAAADSADERRAVMADSLTRGLSAEEGLLVRPLAWWGETDHVFSHIVWDMQVFTAAFGFWQQAERAEQADAKQAEQADPKQVEQADAKQAEQADPKQVEQADAKHAKHAEQVDQANQYTQAAGASYESTGLLAAVQAATYGDVPAPANYRWIGREDLLTLAMPNVFVRILRAYWPDSD